MINLGDKVKDVVTGFEGVAMAKIEYITGCVRYEVLPDKLKEGKPMDSVWIDVSQLTIVKQGFKMRDLFNVDKKDKGGSGNFPKICFPRKV